MRTPALVILWVQTLVGGAVYFALWSGAFPLPSPEPWETTFLILTLISGLLLLTYGILGLRQRFSHPAALPDATP